MRWLYAFFGPAAEIAFGWLWLVRGVDAGGRVLTFYWWCTVAALFGATLIYVLAHWVNRPIPKGASTPRAVRYWLRAIFFARLIAQVAIGCTSLGVLSLTAWLFARFAFLLATEGEKSSAGV
ncbi:hypothetical protein G3N59_01140 [Paraburkholderia sp. Ac-20340]|uniref:hypothetical protein n=1 Tax=Paraburkholderia sp. Ac-20340 TaxID=2703888 RepID=UPI001981CE5E|nr:hypothetical protein [Paraburkholderia sp. Ac-20340]MBN3851972.1 hypothetical protein [Paraburkholderia sp. Ac-20340]